MSDDDIRYAAFAHLQRIVTIYDDAIPWSLIASGFQLNGDQIHFASKAVGIFRPKQMRRGVLSIKTVEPRTGRTNDYKDSETEDGVFVYSLQRSDPNNAHNRKLYEAREDRTPFIYFYAVAESVYCPIWPCYVVDINDKDLKNLTCNVVVGAAPNVISAGKIDLHLPNEVERRYALREVKARLHQTGFRKMVLTAYNNRCAMTNLPVGTLLEAAHIIPDTAEDGDAAVTNGIALSRIHHKAYDSNLLGIDDNYRIHVCNDILSEQDGPLLEGIKQLHGRSLILPRNPAHHPSRENLARRFEDFRQAN